MLTNKIHTIEEHHKIVSNKFDLAHVVIRRTRELMDGARPKPGLDIEFKPTKHNTAPNHSAVKIALEELRTGKLKWTRKPCKPFQMLPLDTVAIIEPTFIKPGKTVKLIKPVRPVKAKASR